MRGGGAEEATRFMRRSDRAPGEWRGWEDGARLRGRCHRGSACAVRARSSARSRPRPYACAKVRGHAGSDAKFRPPIPGCCVSPTGTAVPDGDSRRGVERAIWALLAFALVFRLAIARRIPIIEVD